MAISFRELFVTFALIGVFVFASISFIVETQKSNDVENTILKDDTIFKVYNRTNITLRGFSSQTQTQKESFESEIPERGFGSLIIFAIIGVGQRLTGMMTGVYNILIVLPATILGISPVVISAVTSILVVSLILLAWRVYRSGS